MGWHNILSLVGIGPQKLVVLSSTPPVTPQDRTAAQKLHDERNEQAAILNTALQKEYPSLELWILPFNIDPVLSEQSIAAGLGLRRVGIVKDKNGLPVPDEFKQQFNLRFTRAERGEEFIVDLGELNTLLEAGRAR